MGLNFLLYMFYVIFGLTALLTLASLPGWIKIPDTYRKQLFRAFLIEIGAMVILLFSNNFINPPDNLDVKVSPTSENWIALDADNMEIIQPKLVINNINSASIGLKKDVALRILKNTPLNGKFSDNGLTIKNNSNIDIGYVPNSKLDELQLFNKIDIDDDKLNYKSITFNNKKGKWTQIGTFNKNSPFKVVVTNENGYIIQRKSDSTLGSLMNSYDDVFNSSDSNIDLINKDNRKLHIFSNGSVFHLIFIRSADLENTNPNDHYITFSEVIIQPILNLNI